MNSYDKDHLIAKLIIATIVTVLISLAQITALPYRMVLNGLAVFIWFFGVNPMGYLIETILKHKHSHKKL